MKKHFSCCSFDCWEGRGILPGHFGSMLHRYQFDQRYRGLKEREDLLEEVRSLVANNKPSRRKANIVFEDELDAIEFRYRSLSILHLIYEVEIMGPSSPSHIGCLELSSYFPLDREKCEQYWRGENIQRPEILTLSKINVIRKISV